MSWKKILNELSFRVSDGVPDLTNEQHLMKLYDVLKEHQWPVEARVELIKNLTENLYLQALKSFSKFGPNKFKTIALYSSSLNKK